MLTSMRGFITHREAIVKYTKLTDEQKANVRESTILQIEQEHYANTLALERAEATGNESNIGQIRAIIQSLEVQHKAMVEK